MSIEKKDEEALREFLADIECLDALSPWTERFNIFDILKISRTEIRHSNMLAWLLDPIFTIWSLCSDLPRLTAP